MRTLPLGARRLAARGLLALIGLSSALAVPSVAEPHSDNFPQHIGLPNGFRPEGIAVGKGATFFVGSIPTGAVYRGDLLTGQGAILNPGSEGASSVGLAVDQQERVWVAGGATGQARVIDGRSGVLLAAYQLTTASETFVNDVVTTRQAAYFTDSLNPVLYRVPLDLGPATTIPLTGDLAYQPGFNVNGIDATPDGRTLVVVQTNTGLLFTVEAASGVTRTIDLGGELVTFGDGILLHGKRLYVVQNQANLVAVIDLAPDLRTGPVVDRVSNADFDVPTTIDRFGQRFYVVNARFGTPPTPSAPYWVTGFAGRR
jgi:sugar lactone lactonase YvrE